MTQSLHAMNDTPGKPAPVTGSTLDEKVRNARTQLDEHVRDIVRWHFSPETGTPFWLEKAKSYKFNPLKDVHTFDDLKLFGFFEDDWLRGGPVNRWIPRGLAGKPWFVFETGGTTGIPKSRVVADDFRIDYEMFSDSLPEKFFPKKSNWLMLGPSGPRRLRLAVEHLCQYRGGICFCIDLDPRWVVKLIKKGWMEHLKAYQEHCIDQAMTILSAGHDIKCVFTTPKLLDALALRLEKEGSSIAKAGITGIFCGGTEMTSQWIRFTIEEYLGPDVYIAPTYGNTLMGLAASDMPTAANSYKIAYYAPQPRAVAQVVDFKDYDTVVPVGQTGRVLLTTLTKEFFVPRFAERDEGEREPPYDKYPWDGVSGVRPFHEIAATTTVGVY
jgi:phenylacetate-coenzyme A ligase PaaK-like adenylate-forming protein